MIQTGIDLNNALTTETLLDIFFNDLDTANEKLIDYGFQAVTLEDGTVAVYQVESSDNRDDFCPACGADVCGSEDAADLVEADEDSFNKATINLINSYADGDVSGSTYDNMEVDYEDEAEDEEFVDELTPMQEFEAMASEMLEFLSNFQGREFAIARTKVEEAFMWGASGLVLESQ